LEDGYVKIKGENDSAMHAMFFQIFFFPNLGFGFKAEATGYVSSAICVSKIFGRQRKEDSSSRFKMDPQPDSSIQFKAQGLLYMKSDFPSHTIYENYNF